MLQRVEYFCSEDGKPQADAGAGTLLLCSETHGNKTPFSGSTPNCFLHSPETGLFSTSLFPSQGILKAGNPGDPPPHPAGTGGLSEPPKSLIYPPPAFPSSAAFSCCSGKGGTRQEQLWFIGLLEANTKIQRHINPVCSHCSHPQPATHSDFQH